MSHYSERWWQVASCIYNLYLTMIVFNIACSQAHTPTQMIVFRFLAGLGGSAPLAVGGGTISDLFTPEERG